VAQLDGDINDRDATPSLLRMDRQEVASWKAGQ
jgi:hypothetical protein